MGQCLSCCKRPKDNVLKQDKNIDDKRMFKLGIDVLNRDFCVQIGYNRKAVKTYGQGVSQAESFALKPKANPQGMTVSVSPEEGGVCQTPPSENIVS